MRNLLWSPNAGFGAESGRRRGGLPSVVDGPPMPIPPGDPGGSAVVIPTAIFRTLGPPDADFVLIPIRLVIATSQGTRGVELIVPGDGAVVSEIAADRTSLTPTQHRSVMSASFGWATDGANVPATGPPILRATATRWSRQLTQVPWPGGPRWEIEMPSPMPTIRSTQSGADIGTRV